MLTSRLPIGLRWHRWRTGHRISVNPMNVESTQFSLEFPGWIGLCECTQMWAWTE